KAHATGNGNAGKAKGDLSIFGQESNATTWRLAKMNLAIRGIEGDLGDEPADSFHRDLHKDLKADYILANPPFNMSDWGGDRVRGEGQREGKFRDRRGETLFIDARKLGTMIDRVHRDLTVVDIQKIAGTYHASRFAWGVGGRSARVGRLECCARSRRDSTECG